MKVKVAQSCLTLCVGFLGSSAGKERIHLPCRIPRFNPGSGRSAGEGIGYPLEYSWAYLVAQLIKNLPVMSEAWVQSLGWEDSLEKGTVTHAGILDWRIPWTWGRKESDTTERLTSLLLVCMCAYTSVQCMHTSACMCTYILFLGGLVANSLDRRMDSVLERPKQEALVFLILLVSSSYVP